MRVYTNFDFVCAWLGGPPRSQCSRLRWRRLVVDHFHFHSFFACVLRCPTATHHWSLATWWVDLLCMCQSDSISQLPRKNMCVIFGWLNRVCVCVFVAVRTIFFSPKLDDNNPTIRNCTATDCQYHFAVIVCTDDFGMTLEWNEISSISLSLSFCSQTLRFSRFFFSFFNRLYAISLRMLLHAFQIAENDFFSFSLLVRVFHAIRMEKDMCQTTNTDVCHHTWRETVERGIPQIIIKTD